MYALALSPSIYRRFMTLLLLLLLLLLLTSSLVTGFSFLVLLLTSGDPHRSGFKRHTAVLSVLCVMFQVLLLYD
jgi:hypothetical protein